MKKLIKNFFEFPDKNNISTLDMIAYLIVCLVLIWLCLLLCVFVFATIKHYFGIGPISVVLIIIVPTCCYHVFSKMNKD